MHKNTATKYHESKSLSLWRVDLGGDSKYIVTTYPNSDLRLIEKQPSGRIVTGRLLRKTIDQLIAEAS
jgi:hypothetical protein